MADGALNSNTRNVKEWKDIEQESWYSKLDSNEKELVKRQYFETVIRPRLPEPRVTPTGPNSMESAWAQFHDYTMGKSPIKEPWAITYAPDIGGFLGSVAGTAASAVTGLAALPTILPLVAAGGGGGAAIRQAWRKEHNPGMAPRDLPEAIGDITAGAGSQMTGEFLGQAGNIGVSKAVSPVARALKPREGAPEAQNLLQKYGGSLSAGQATNLSGLESIAREGLLSRMEFKALDVKNKLAVLKARNDLVGDLTSIPESQVTKESGNIIQNAIEKGDQAHKRLAAQMYDDLDAQISFAMRPRLIQAGKITPRQDIVDLSPTKQWAKQQINAYTKRGTPVPTALSEFMATPDRLSIKDAFLKRSDMLASARATAEATTETAMANNRVYDTLQGKILDNMDAGAKKAERYANYETGSIYSTYRKVSDFYREGRQAFNDDLIVKLAKEKPEKLADTLFSPGNETDIARVKQVLQQASRYDPSIKASDVWGNMQAAWLTKQLSSRAAVDAEKGTKGAVLWKIMNADKDRRTFEAVFDQGQQQRIKSFFDAIDLSQRGSSQLLHVGVPLTQIGAVSYLVYTGTGNESRPGSKTALGATAILLGPKALSIALTRPALVNKLTGAMSTSLQSSAGMQASKDLIPELLELGGQVVRTGANAAGNLVVKETLPTIGRSVVMPQVEQLIRDRQR